MATVSYPILYHDFLSTFVGRWNEEASNFNLPIREMTITLDDVSCLLHPPLMVSYWTINFLFLGLRV